MADDLDAFFDEVSEVAEKAKKEEEEETADVEQPPNKKQKTAAPPPLRPKGVVVAAKAAAAAPVAPSVDSNQNINDNNAPSISTSSVPSSIGPTVPPPPPPPPPHVPVGPLAPPPLPAGPPPSGKPHIRAAAGKTWVDPVLAEWPDNDFRLFVGNLSPELTDEQLLAHVADKFPSCQRARVVRDAKGISKGYGFVSLLDALECAKALRQLDQSWLGSRPIRVKRSQWKERELKQVRKKQKKTKKNMGLL